VTRQEFGGLVGECEPYLWRVSLALLRSEADAGDALQDALLTAYAKRHQFRGDRASFRFWVRRILVHSAGAILRARQRVIPVAEVAPPDAWQAGDNLVWHLVSRLPRHLAQVIVLKYLFDLKQAEIAETLGIPLGTVKSRLNKGLSLLRNSMGDQEEVLSR
jgi:RNA polymerase sigma-70 factor (ECF subfamily)